MTLQYIENPVIRTHQTKAIVKEIMMSGETFRWVIVSTSETKTEKELHQARQKVAQNKNVYSLYPLEWAVHEDENNYSVIVRKLETK